MTKEEDFSKYGNRFQESLVSLIFQDRAFSDQIREVLDISFLELKYLRAFVQLIFDHRDNFGSHPSSDALSSIIRADIGDHSEIIQKQIREYFARILSSGEVRDAEYIKKTALDFCRKQKLKEALLQSADLINSSKSTSYDEVREKINTALKLGAENNFGYDYIADFEERFLLKSRNPVSTSWKEMDKITLGGLGCGELGVVIAPTGVGKSMALAYLGAQAVKAGKIVVHYTLELLDTVVAMRYDSCITGINISDLVLKKDDVWDEIKDIEGRLIVKEYPTKTASTQTIKNHLDKLKSRDIEPDLIIVDYGDLLRPVDKRKEKRNELESIYEELRGVAQIYDCPVWTASQTNRTGLNAEVITMESISEAFNKCFVADFIFTISRTGDDKALNEGRIFIAKNRNGPDGIVFPIHMETRNVNIQVKNRYNAQDMQDLSEKAAKNQRQKLMEKYRQIKEKG